MTILINVIMAFFTISLIASALEAIFNKEFRDAGVCIVSLFALFVGYYSWLVLRLHLITSILIVVVIFILAVLLSLIINDLWGSKVEEQLKKRAKAGDKDAKEALKKRIIVGKWRSEMSDRLYIEFNSNGTFYTTHEDISRQFNAFGSGTAGVKGNYVVETGESWMDIELEFVEEVFNDETLRSVSTEGLKRIRNSRNYNNKLKLGVELLSDSIRLKAWGSRVPAYFGSF